MQSSDIITYREMCDAENLQVMQRGMNYRINQNYSIVLMSRRANAPYNDNVLDNGNTIVYEGHNISRANGVNPEAADQPEFNVNGNLTQNGLFKKAALLHKHDGVAAELVKVYEKLMPGVWCFNGIFKLVDCWVEISENRNVFKFKMSICDDVIITEDLSKNVVEHNRMIPSKVKQEVWKRDKGECVLCKSKKNLHFDHIIPFSKGGASNKLENIQLLCSKHNLAKRDKIE